MIRESAAWAAFDDVANQESLVHDGDPVAIGITLDGFQPSVAAPGR